MPFAVIVGQVQLMKQLPGLQPSLCSLPLQMLMAVFTCTGAVQQHWCSALL